MIKNIFKKLNSDEQHFNNHELEFMMPFIKDEIIIKEADAYRLNTKYRVGTLKVEKKHAVLEDFDNVHKNIKLDFEKLNGAYNNDLVLAQRVFNPRSKSKAKIIRVLDTKSSSVLVYVKKGDTFTIKEGIEIPTKKAFHSYAEGDVLLINNKSFEVVEHFGNIEEAKVDEKISLFLYDEMIRLEKDFDVDAQMNDTKNRVDLTRLPFTTIDPASAKDHDDAIYYDKKASVLYVAIADVSYFVKEDSALDKIAFEKSTSIYLPHRVLPMLPPALSEEMCSLKENVNRYAYVFKIYLDKQNLEVKKSELFEAIIKSHKKFSYGRIDRVLEGQYDQYSEVEKSIFDYIGPLYELTKKFRAKRLKNGYDFRTKEYRQKLNYNYELEAITVEESTDSHQLVEECMLLANIEASKKVSNVGIYRIHDEPSIQAMTKLVDDVNLLGVKVKVKNSVHDTITHIQDKAKYSGLIEEVDDLIIKSQSQAKYSSKNLGHFGLGFKSYSHFTSPIRRYSDLVLHRMLKSKKVPSGIDDVCEHISTQERKVDQLVWDFEDRKYARWAKEHIGEEFKAQIVDVDRSIARFYETLPGLRVHLENIKGQKQFTKLKVIIQSVDVISKKIFAVIKE